MYAMLYWITSYGDDSDRIWACGKREDDVLLLVDELITSNKELLLITETNQKFSRPYNIYIYFSFKLSEYFGLKLIDMCECMNIRIHFDIFMMYEYSQYILICFSVWNWFYNVRIFAIYIYIYIARIRRISITNNINMCSRSI